METATSKPCNSVSRTQADLVEPTEFNTIPQYSREYFHPYFPCIEFDSMKTMFALSAVVLGLSFAAPSFAATRQQAVTAINDGSEAQSDAQNECDYAEYRIDEYEYYQDTAMADGYPGPYPSLNGFRTTLADLRHDINQDANGPSGHLANAESLLQDGDNAGTPAAAANFYGQAKSEGENAKAESLLLLDDAEDLVEDILASENAFIAAWTAWAENQE